MKRKYTIGVKREAPLHILNTLLALSILTCSANVFAATEHECTFDMINIKILTDKENDIYLSLSKGNVKFTSCKMKVTSHDDGKRGRSVEELTRFEKISCDVVDAKLASEVTVIDEGYIKISPDQKYSSAYVLKNEQPLKCRSK